MPKRAKELSAIEVRRLKKPGLHPAGGVSGLCLAVSNTGATSWILRTMIGGKRCDMGLGAFPEVTLASARKEAAEVKARIRSGVDVVAERKALKRALAEARESTVTFDRAVERYLKGKVQELANPKHAAQWASTLATYASPVFGHLPVSEVELSHIMRCLEPIWLTKTETAKRLRGRIESVLAWATVHGYRKGDNPARWKGNLDTTLPKPGKVTKVVHHAALPWREMPVFMAALKLREGTAARALEFLIMTAARSGEVRGATWAEIDFEAKLWVIPKERMKAGKEHRVPLSDAAIALLERLPRFIDSEYVFAAPRGGALSDMSISAVCRRMKVEAVPHGFRSSFRDWAAEATAYPNTVCEMALAHTIGNAVEAAYRRGDLLDKRRKLMADWSKFLAQPATTGEVIPIRRRAQA